MEVQEGEGRGTGGRRSRRRSIATPPNRGGLERTQQIEEDSAAVEQGMEAQEEWPQRRKRKGGRAEAVPLTVPAPPCRPSNAADGGGEQVTDSEAHNSTEDAVEWYNGRKGGAMARERRRGQDDGMGRGGDAAAAAEVQRAGEGERKVERSTVETEGWEVGGE